MSLEKREFLDEMTKKGKKRKFKKGKKGNDFSDLRRTVTCV